MSFNVLTPNNVVLLSARIDETSPPLWKAWTSLFTQTMNVFSLIFLYILRNTAYVMESCMCRNTNQIRNPAYHRRKVERMFSFSRFAAGLAVTDSFFLELPD